MAKKLKRKILRNKRLNRFVANILTLYVRLCYKTTRWDKEGLDEMSRVVASGQPVILVIWHERLLMGPLMFDTRAGDVCSILTVSRMAFLGTFMLENLGFDAIMIPPKASPLSLNREVFRRIQNNQSIVISPDGTRGPARVAKAFPIVWARKTQIPIFVCAYSVRRSLRLPTWDRAHIALPFNRGSMLVRRWTEEVPKKANTSEVEALRVKLDAALNDVTDDADRRVDKPPDPRH